MSFRSMSFRLMSFRHLSFRHSSGRHLPGRHIFIYFIVTVMAVIDDQKFIIFRSRDRIPALIPLRLPAPAEFPVHTTLAHHNPRPPVRRVQSAANTEIAVNTRRPPVPQIQSLAREDLPPLHAGHAGKHGERIHRMDDHARHISGCQFLSALPPPRQEAIRIFFAQHGWQRNVIREITGLPT